MKALQLRRLEGDVHLFVRAGLGLSILVAVTWAYWLVQMHG